MTISQILLVIVVALICVIFIPKIQTRKIKYSKPDSINSQAKIIEVENQLRQTLAQIIGGAVFLFGVYTGVQQLRDSKDLRLSNKFHQSIVGLSTPDSIGPLIKIEALYNLESIALESPDEYWCIFSEL